MAYSPHLQRVRTFPDQRTANAFYERNYRPLLRDLPEGLLVDLGSGLGEFLQYCQDVLGRPAVGVDQDPQNVALCRVSGLQVEEMPIERFLATSRPAALFVLNDVLEHFSREESAELLRSLHRLLAPGGRIIIKTPNMSNPLTAGRNFHMDLTHRCGFTEESLHSALEEAGFVDIQLLPVDIYVTRNPLANLGGRVLSQLTYAWWRFAYKVQGVPRVQILTKGIIASGKAPSGAQETALSASESAASEVVAETAEARAGSGS